MDERAVPSGRRWRDHGIVRDRVRVRRVLGQVPPELGSGPQVAVPGGVRVVVGPESALPVTEVADPGGAQLGGGLARSAGFMIVRSRSRQGVHQRLLDRASL